MRMNLSVLGLIFSLSFHSNFVFSGIIKVGATYEDSDGNGHIAHLVADVGEVAAHFLE